MKSINGNEKETKNYLKHKESKPYDFKRQISQIFQKNLLNKSGDESSNKSLKYMKIKNQKGRSKSIDINKQKNESVALKRYKKKANKIGNDDSEVK